MHYLFYFTVGNWIIYALILAQLFLGRNNSLENWLESNLKFVLKCVLIEIYQNLLSDCWSCVAKENSNFALFRIDGALLIDIMLEIIIF